MILKEKVRNIMAELRAAFYWGETRQGYDYWAAVYQSLDNLILQQEMEEKKSDLTD